MMGRGPSIVGCSRTLVRTHLLHIHRYRNTFAPSSSTLHHTTPSTMTSSPTLETLIQERQIMFLRYAVSPIYSKSHAQENQPFLMIVFIISLCH